MSDDSRLWKRAADAFVDGAPIDWTALLSRARTRRDRSLLDNLRGIAIVRARHRTRPRSRTAGRLATLGAWLVVVAGTITSGAAALALGFALASGETIVNRTPQIVLTLAFGIACAPLARAARHEPRSLFLLAAFASSAAVFARSAFSGLAWSWSASVDALVQGATIEAFTPACLWQFALDFPRVRRFTTFDRVATRAAALVWLLACALFIVNLLGAFAIVDPGPLASLTRQHPSRVFWQIFAIALVSAVAAIFVRSLRAPGAERRRVARFACALAGGSAPFLLSGVLWTLLPEMHQRLVEAGGHAIGWLDGLALTALTAMPILATAAVIVDEPAGSQTISRRGWPAALARGAVKAIQAALALTTLFVLWDVRHALGTTNGSSAWTLLLLLVIAAAGLLVAAQPTVLATIERRLFRRGASHDEQLARAIDRIRVARGAREILAATASELGRSVGARTTVLVETREGLYVDPMRGDARLPAASGLIAMLRETAIPLDLSAGGRWRRLLPPNDRDWLDAHDVELAAALKRTDESIAAVVVMSAKHGGFPFDRRDSWLIASLTAASAAALGDAHVAGASGSTALGGSTTRESDDAALQCARCGAIAGSMPLPCGCASDVMLASVPHRLGDKLVVTRRLGSGGMAVVYLAKDVLLDREVALKTLPALRPDAIDRLRVEARAMASLNHEGLATIYSLELWQRTPILVVEYFPRGTLARAIADHALAPRDAVQLAITLAQALSYMHGRGMLHRDLKPSNIGLTAAGAPKLLDFGLAAIVDRTSATSAGSTDFDRDEPTAGTPAYLPPEAFEGAPPSTSFDLWALSVTLLEAIAGAHPFAQDDRALAKRAHDSLQLSDRCRRKLDTCPALRTYFDRALALDAEQRFRDAADMLAALESLERALTI